MNEQIEKDVRITMKDLFFYILRKWRVIVLMGFGCAFLFGACRGIKLLSMTHSDEYQKKVRTSYEDKIEKWEDETKKLDRKISRLEKKLEEKKIYLEQSLLMMMDPNDSCVATADLLVYGTQEAGDASVLASIYQNALNSENIFRKLAEEYCVEEKYICELVKTTTREFVATLPDGEQGIVAMDKAILHIGLIAEDEKMAKEFMDEIILSLRAMSDDMNESGSTGVKNNLTVLNYTCMNRMVEELEEYQYTIHDAVDSISDDLDANIKEKDDLEKPDDKAPWSMNEIFLSSFKYFLLGGFIGGLLSLFLFLFVCLYSNKVLSPDELRKHTGLKVITVSKTEGKGLGSKIDNYISSIELTGELLPLKSIQRLQELDNDIEKYAIWGDQLEESLVKLFPDSENKTVLDMERMDSWRDLMPAKGYEEAEDHTKFVLFADRTKTTYQEIDYKLEVIRQLKGKDIMFVFYI